jgi:co-chaperonin GroES (HSP10)
MTIDNKSGITPVGVSILILPEQVEEVSEGGVIIAVGTEVDRMQLRQTYGDVVEISPGAYDDIPVRCKAGDRVIMAAYAGMIITGKDGLDYRLIRDVDVVGILEKGVKFNERK